MASNFVPADLIRWEVEYDDNTTDRESEGKKYGGINRSRLQKFKLINEAGATIFETWPPVGKNGHNFIYRRRSRIMESGQKMTIFVIGWLPDGPAYAVNVADSSYRMLEDGFNIADPDMYPPEPMPGELWFADNQS